MKETEIEILREVKDHTKYWCITNMGDILYKVDSLQKADELTRSWPKGYTIYNSETKTEIPT